MLRFLVFLLVPLVLSGCGPSERPFTDNSQDADLYAQDVKQLALDAVQRARRSREPADQIQTIVNELDGMEANKRPAGSHKATYAELLTLAKQFVEECKKVNGKPTDLTARLDSLKLLAEKLPGKVDLGRK